MILFNHVDCWYKKRNICDHLQFFNIQKMLQETSDIASGFWPPGVPLGQQIGGGGSGELLLAGHHLQKKERQIKNMSVLVFTSNFAYLGTGLALCTACFLCSATFTSAHSVSNEHKVELHLLQLLSIFVFLLFHLDRLRLLFPLPSLRLGISVLSETLTSTRMFGILFPNIQQKLILNIQV